MKDYFTDKEKQELKKVIHSGAQSLIRMYKIGFIMGMTGNKKLLKEIDRLKLTEEEIKSIRNSIGRI